MNLALKREMEDCGIQVEHGKEDKLFITGRASAMRSILEKMEAGDIPVKFKTNKDHFKDTVFEGSTSFCGGTYSQLKSEIAGKINMTQYLETRRAIDRSDIAKRIKTIAATGAPKRKRVRSEHDGDWSYDNRWEIKPYDSAIRQATQTKTINLVCDFSINSATDPESINDFGCLVWAISDLLESSGVQTRIVYRKRSKNTGRITNKVDVHDRFRLILKEPGEYLNPASLAAMVTANYYRRAIFGLKILACDVVGAIADSGLGQSVSCPPVEFKDGELVIASSTRGLTESVERELYKALNISMKGN